MVPYAGREILFRRGQNVGEKRYKVMPLCSPPTHASTIHFTCQRLLYDCITLISKSKAKSAFNELFLSKSFRELINRESPNGIQALEILYP